MARRFTVNCDFGGQMSPFAVYIGKPEKKHHPLHFQADWLSKERGGTIPAEVMDAVSQLQELAEKNNVPLEDLCVYALGTEEEKEELEQKEQEQEAEDMASEGGHVEADHEEYVEEEEKKAKKKKK